ncbi:uncharacterized protein FIBRA_09353 [Fibroporia radiculosa]|uniref:Uncharacterized protein n=1 Tax=Fibroporia radiculosa TaxID=599839 RepID=J7S6C7_9APHY|nr:uncharacterized protein FIBRA_09353 [Fibroporia radiculosa]CCM07034.1 predicted protein [Fibroporia radiculosa]
MDHESLREKFGRFRVLIIGRANAGKTTILKKVCDTTDNPEIFDGRGNKIDSASVAGSISRGEHNIQHEMVFSSNPGFIFHDSRGFEAGREDEFEEVKSFVAEHASTTKLKERIHVIW